MYGQTAVGNDGMTKGCVGNDYQPCDNNAATECVGKEADNYVYKLVEPGETCDNFGILKLTLSFPINCILLDYANILSLLLNTICVSVLLHDIQKHVFG